MRMDSSPLRRGDGEAADTQFVSERAADPLGRGASARKQWYGKTGLLQTRRSFDPARRTRRSDAGRLGGGKFGRTSHTGVFPGGGEGGARRFAGRKAQLGTRGSEAQVKRRAGVLRQGPTTAWLMSKTSLSPTLLLLPTICLHSQQRPPSSPSQQPAGEA